MIANVAIAIFAIICHNTTLKMANVAIAIFASICHCIHLQNKKSSLQYYNILYSTGVQFYFNITLQFNIKHHKHNKI